MTNCTGMCHFADICIWFEDFFIEIVNSWEDIAGHMEWRMVSYTDDLVKNMLGTIL